MRESLEKNLKPKTHIDHSFSFTPPFSFPLLPTLLLLQGKFSEGGEGAGGEEEADSGQ